MESLPIKHISLDPKNEIDRMTFERFVWQDFTSDMILIGKDEFVFHGYVEKNLQKILDFEVYDDDIWVCTFLRSGTTWTQEMIASLVTKNFDEKDLREIFPFFERTATMDFGKFAKESKVYAGKEIPEYLTDSLEFIRKMPRPRMIKTHLPWDLLPRQIQTGERKPRIVHVSRNTKDVIISLYHFFKLTSQNQIQMSLEEHFKMFINNRLPYTPYWAHVNSYRKQKHRPNIFFNSYEYMKNNLREVVEKMIKFLDIKNFTESDVEKLLNNLQFDKMRNNSKVNFVSIIGKTEGEDQFVRKGQTGQYKSEMTDEMIRICDERDQLYFKDI